jgi:hypothetical protein
MLGLLAGLAPAAATAKQAWPPVPPEDLASTMPKLEPEAAAEVLEWILNVDDSQPNGERITTEYIRYKIFDPQRSESLARVSSFAINFVQDRNEVSARVISPNGKIQEFGREAIKERSLMKPARERGFFGWLSSGSDLEVTEKFLAVTGLERGAILEYQFKRVEPMSLVTSFVAQREGIPVRSLEITLRPYPGSPLNNYSHQVFVFNQHSAKLSQDPKAKTVTIKATNLPSTVVEPVMGPATDYAMTILSCYTSRDVVLSPRSDKVPVPGTVADKYGPWSFFATVLNWSERDRGWPTRRVQQLAADLTATAKDGPDKARLVHEHVRAMYQQWAKRKTKPPEQRTAPKSLDDVIDWEKKPEVILIPDEFLWLALALDQAAGLEAHIVALPNRQLSRFYQENVSPIFLPYRAIALHFDEEWRFSAPHNGYALPFGMLPWQQEGQTGLLALDRKETFIRVPAAGPKQSLTTSIGVFDLDREGTLEGTCRRAFTGHAAAFLRAELLAAPEEKRNEIARAKFGLDPKTVELTVTGISSLTETEKPVKIVAKLRWPGFATLTKDRLVVRPSVFRTDSTSPFSAEQRRHPVHFPYRWMELDRVSIRVPDDYAPESPVAPGPLPGEVLSSKTQIGYEREKNTLHMLREFSSNVMDVAPAEYATLRTWYAALIRANQHEIVFLKKAAATKAETKK